MGLSFLSYNSLCSILCRYGVSDAFFFSLLGSLLYSTLGAHSLTSPPSWSRGLSSWSSLNIGYSICGCWALSILGITFWGGLEIVLCYYCLVMIGLEGSGTGTAGSSSETASSSSLILGSSFFFAVSLSPPSPASFCDLISSSSMFLLAAAAVSNCDNFYTGCAYEKTPLRGPEDSILALLKTEALSRAFGCIS